MCLKCGVRWEKTVHELEKIQTSKIVEGLERTAKEFVLCPLGSEIGRASCRERV